MTTEQTKHLTNVGVSAGSGGFTAAVVMLVARLVLAGPTQGDIAAIKRDVARNEQSQAAACVRADIRRDRIDDRLAHAEGDLGKLRETMGADIKVMAADMGHLREIMARMESKLDGLVQ